jgi:DNA-binding response OmpR family regulator
MEGSMAKILVVEDEQQIVRVVRAYLERAGHLVVATGDGQMALHQFRHERPDLIVLDLMLPGMDGLDVCRTIRRESDVPIIMLTARVEEIDRLIGLELGADDYVTKPFSPRELVARVRAVLRRTRGGERPTPLITAAAVAIDPDRRRVTVRGLEADLTATEFDLLAALASAPGRVFSRMELLDRVQGESYVGYERTIDTHIKNLRRKIEVDPHHPQLIETLYGVGYRFREPRDA